MVCSIVYVSTTKIVQIMTLRWPWSILREGQIWLHMLLYGRKWNFFFFGNYCSLRSQSCLKHSTKWVNEVEYQRSRSFFDLVKGHSDFKVKCLTVACIFRWAIQGLMALLFEIIAALGLKVARSIQINELMKLSEYQRSIFDLGQRSLRFQS